MAIFALACLFLGIFSFSCVGYPRIYKRLILPPFSPSPLFFAVVWSVIFLVLGAVAGAIVGARCTASRVYKRAGLFYYFAAIILTLMWYPVFFGAKAFFLALLIIPFMMLLFLIAAKYFFRISCVAAFLVILIQGWLFYSFVLNLCAVILN